MRSAGQSHQRNLSRRRDSLFVKAHPYHTAGVADGHGIGGHVPRHHRARADDAPVADARAGQEGDALADPDVVAKHRIALEGQILKARHARFPAAAHDVEGIGGGRTHAMVGAVHDKGHAAGDGAGTCR